MKLVQTTGREFTASCLGCNKPVVCGDNRPGLADLEGPAFKAYYHPACAAAKTGSQGERKNLEKS